MECTTNGSSYSNPGYRVRVLIIDDSAFMRKVISEMIASDPDFEVIGTARDGEDGVAKAKKMRPDLITLDIEMPKKDGLTALREIKALCRDFEPAVLMCSSLTVAGSHEAFKALRIGAADVIGKDPSVVGKKDGGFKAELLSKLHAIGTHRASPHKLNTSKALKAEEKPITHYETNEIDFDRVQAVVVGSSTGGPPVLEEIFSKLTSNLSVPIIVAQHMPELFTKSLTSRLDQHCSCDVRHATHSTMLSKPGIYIAQGGSHIKPTRIAGRKIIAKLVDKIPGAVYRPSVDLLFEKASDIFGSGLLAIQLTGMGADGAKGAQAVKKSGGQIIAQNGSSCVVYGMPKAVVDLGIADQILSPHEIRDLLSHLNRKQDPNAHDQPDPDTDLRKSA
jgi:two-component system, chemotaxis family, protein-glutamate methylesterase/glutaminase